MAAFLQRYKASGVLNMVGGFIAAMLIQAEMTGVAAA